MSEWFFTSDLHGQSSLYEQVLSNVAARRPGAVILGGDLAPHAAGADGVAHQRVFYEGFLIEFARRVQDASAQTRLLVLMGNDDWAANHDCLERHHGTLWHVLHDRVVSVAGRAVAGLSWVPITPFALKDWDRWDDGEPETPGRLDGWTSRDGVLAPVRFDPDRREPTIAAALDDLARRTPAAETVFVLHSPPRDTRCDMVRSGWHVGSRAIRRFVSEHRPPLVLSGHIHESPRVSASWRDTIEGATVVNPGQFGTQRLCGVWFDPDRPADTLRHTVYG